MRVGARPAAELREVVAGSLPDRMLVFVTTAVLVAIVILVIGQLVFRRFDGRFAQEL